MLQYLNRAQRRKGFTMIELIVVIAILGVMAAIILPMVSARDSKIQEANSAARDFYTAMQSVMTKFSMYEGPLSPAYEPKVGDPNLGEMRYFESMGGNYPYAKGSTASDFPNTTSLYIEFAVKNNSIIEVYSSAIEKSSATDANYDNGVGLYNLCTRASSMKDTEFGRLLKAEIEDRIRYRDGFYYAKVTYKNILTSTIPQKMEAETVKVEYTGYSNRRLPQPGSLAFNDYRNANLYFGEDNVLVNDNVFGVCAPLNTGTGTIVGMAGTSLN